MKTYLPTLEECEKIVETNEAFYAKEEVFDGQRFKIFNYRLASFSDFLIPGTIEMRGITFNLDTGERWLSIHKFFNNDENPFTLNGETIPEIDETVEWDYTDELDIRDKRDGSLINTLLVNDKVVLKTKGTFYSDQALECSERIEPELEDFLYKLLKCGYTPLLEFTSPENRIVVNYNVPELKILQIRDYFGKYLTYDEIINDLDIPKKFLVDRISLTFKEILERQETEKGIEGWIVFNPKAKNLQTAFRKVKTAEYFTLHRLVSPNELVENRLIACILDETLDDILAVCNDFQRKKFTEMEILISHYFNKNLKHCEELYDELCVSERKEFAKKNNEFKFFGVVMRSKSKDEIKINLIEMIKKQTQKLTGARELLKKLKEENV